MFYLWFGNYRRHSILLMLGELRPYHYLHQQTEHCCFHAWSNFASGIFVYIGLLRCRGPPSISDFFTKKFRKSEEHKMAYNWAREEEWRQWKKAEEEQLRELGVSEDFIKDLHAYDWDMFNDDRRFYDHYQETGSYLETLVAVEDQKEIRTTEDLLDEIDDPELYQALKKLNKVTLMVAVLKMNGRSAKEIASLLGLTEVAVLHRLSFMRKKLKKFSK